MLKFHIRQIFLTTEPVQIEAVEPSVLLNHGGGHRCKAAASPWLPAPAVGRLKGLCPFFLKSSVCFTSSGRNASHCTESMWDAPAATSTHTFQMFCFGPWSCSFPQLLCQPPWSSSRPAAIFQPRYLDYSFLDWNINLPKAGYEGITCLEKEERALSVINGSAKKFLCEQAARVGVEGAEEGGEGKAFWDRCWKCTWTPGFSPPNPKD